MTYHNVEIPQVFEYGSSFGIGFNTKIQASPLGHEQRFSQASQGRHRFSMRASLQDDYEMYTLKEFVLGRRGGFAGFKLKDFQDFTTALDGVQAPTFLDQILGSGDGTTREFYLYKTYDASGPAPYQRRIELPVSGTVVIAESGVSTTSFSVNTNGVVLFDVAPTNGTLLTFGCEFRVPVRFEKSVDELLAIVANAYGNWNPSAFNCVEILDEVEWPDRYWPGGSSHLGTLAVDYPLSFNDGTLLTFKTSAAIYLILPSPGNAPSGAPLFTFWNDPTSSHAATLILHDGSAFTTIGIGATVSVGFSRSTSGDIIWAVV